MTNLLKQLIREGKIKECSHSPQKRMVIFITCNSEKIICCGSGYIESFKYWLSKWYNKGEM